MTPISDHWQAASLSAYESGFFDDVDPDDRFVAFLDPSNYEYNPGWMLRNLLVLVRQRWKLDHVQILCYREPQSRRDEGRSIVLKLHVETPPADVAQDPPRAPAMPKVTGWERNRDGKLTSKVANLADYLDPRR